MKPSTYHPVTEPSRPPPRWTSRELQAGSSLVASQRKLDPNHIGIYGHSAAGHLAAGVGSMDDPKLEGDGGYEGIGSKVRAVVDSAGPSAICHLCAADSLSSLLTGKRPNRIHGAIGRFAEALRKAGIPMELVVVKNGEHSLRPGYLLRARRRALFTSI